MRKITELEELLQVKRELGVREDWHEPDEQAVTATVSGRSFDNAGFWGTELPRDLVEAGGEEMAVTLYSGVEDGEPVPYAIVNLATLFAWATRSSADRGLDRWYNASYQAGLRDGEQAAEGRHEGAIGKAYLTGYKTGADTIRHRVRETLDAPDEA